MDYRMNNDFVDYFDAVFTDNCSIIAEVKNPLGHFAAQALCLEQGLLSKIISAVRDFKYEFNIFLSARDVSSAALAQQELNRLYTLLRRLPAYELLAARDKKSEQLLHYMRSHPDEVDDMITSGTERNKMLRDWLMKLESIPRQLQDFERSTRLMLEDYFKDLRSRKPENYIQAYGSFRYIIADAIYQNEDPYDVEFAQQFRFTFPVEISYQPTLTEKGFVLAEKMIFDDLINFLHVDFCKGIGTGNLPRRCENCGKYFLAMGAYDTRYCNDIAPGETSRTCRMVGAHKKEKAKSNSQPILKEYNRVYNRIKARKRNGIITPDEWNRLVGQIQDLKEAALSGKYSDEELKKIYDEI